MYIYIYIYVCQCINYEGVNLLNFTEYIIMVTLTFFIMIPEMIVNDRECIDFRKLPFLNNLIQFIRYLECLVLFL